MSTYNFHIIIPVFVECIISSKMALYINNNHILYYHMDAVRSYLLGHTYFTSPDYLVVQRWIRATLPSSSNTILDGKIVYRYSHGCFSFCFVSMYKLICGRGYFHIILLCCVEDYLAVQRWIRATFPSSSNTILDGKIVYRYSDGCFSFCFVSMYKLICGRCYFHIILLCCVEDGKPLWQMLWPCVFSKWQMLLPQMADGMCKHVYLM